MKDNALSIMLFMYCVSGGLVIVDTLLAAPMGIDLADADGNPIGPQIRAIHERMHTHDMEYAMLEAAGAMDVGSHMERAVAGVELGVAMSVEMFKMLLGLYVFDILILLGIPREAVALITSVYVILLARALLGYMPAIAAAVQALVVAGRAVGSVAGPAAGATARMLHLR